MSKAVIYYSLTGNTKEAAKEIARKLGAKLFEIDLAKPLPRKPAAKMLVRRNAVHIWKNTENKRRSR